VRIPGDLLDRPHRVKGHPCVRDHRAPRLHRHARHGESILLAFGFDPVDDHLAELLHGGGLVWHTIGDTQAAAHIEHAHAHAGLGADLAHERHHDLDRLRVAAKSEDLAPDVHVESFEIQPWQRECTLHGLHREPLVEAEAELGVLGPRHDEVVGVGCDPRCHADEDALAHTPVRGERREALHLLEVVHHDPPDAGIETLGELGGSLVVAVHLARRSMGKPARTA